MQPLSSQWTVRLKFGRIFTEVENCRKREEVVEEVDDVVKESAAAARGISRRTVDRSGRPSAAAADRSTGPVDGRAQHAQRSSGRPVRSTAEGERSTARSTD